MDPLTPLWIATAPGSSFPQLESPLGVDVLVVGGGIAGLTTALFARERGADVALVESDRIGLGATARATVKVTAGHGLRYGEISRRHGEDAAGVYADLNLSAIDTIAGIVERHGIDCSFETRRHLVCAEGDDERVRVEQEVELERRIGLPVSFSDDCDLPFPVAGCLVMDGQAQFHPRRYLLGLADAFVAAGGTIFEGSRAEEIDDGDPCIVRANGVEARARDVVVATGAPISDRGLLMARMVPSHEYAVAAELSGRGPSDTYLSAADGAWSLRTADIADRRYLVVVGAKHEVGRPPDTDPYDELDGWMRERFPVGPMTHRWSTHDLWPADALPYVGRLGAGAGHLWAATGFGGWGMTNGTAAGSLLSELIAGGDAGDAARLLDPGRGDVTAAPVPFVRQNVQVAGRWVGDRIRSRSGDAADVEPLAGEVLREGGELVATYRDERGRLHAVSAVCTHMGCIVGWNGADRTWDCPCHGSRFDIDGNVVSAPATEPLRKIQRVGAGDDGGS